MVVIKNILIGALHICHCIHLQVGCALCLLGATVVVIHAPQETEVSSMEDLKAKLVDPGKSYDLL